MELAKITDLLERYGTYQEETGNDSLEHFAFWLLKRQEQNPQKEADLGQLHRDIGYHLNRVNKFSKYLSRYFLAGLEIDSLDEFSFLTAIRVLDHPSKTEVYDFTITELTTGQQMMRRLVKKGLVEEYPDAKDQRKKCLRLSRKGEETQFKAFDLIGQECDLKFGALDLHSKQFLLQVLRQLDAHNTQNLSAIRQEKGR